MAYTEQEQNECFEHLNKVMGEFSRALIEARAHTRKRSMKTRIDRVQGSVASFYTDVFEKGENPWLGEEDAPQEDISRYL